MPVDERTQKTAEEMLPGRASLDRQAKHKKPVGEIRGLPEGAKPPAKKRAASKAKSPPAAEADHDNHSVDLENLFDSVVLLQEVTIESLRDMASVRNYSDASWKGLCTSISHTIDELGIVAFGNRYREARNLGED